VSAYRHSRLRDDLPGYISMGLVVVFIITVAIFYVVKSNHSETVSFTVSSKERVCESGKGGCKYLVFTEEGEVFENKDRKLQGKTRSSDLQGCLKPGQRYDNVKVIGWRNGWLSWYRNIMEVPACPI
jgi:hypothetical protein